MSALSRDDACQPSKERGEEATHEKEQPSADREQREGTRNTPPSAERNFEGGFGGQEDLEDRYATTCGEH